MNKKQSLKYLNGILIVIGVISFIFLVLVLGNTLSDHIISLENDTTEQVNITPKNTAPELTEKAKLLSSNYTGDGGIHYSCYDCLIYRYKDGKTYIIGLWTYQYGEMGFFTDNKTTDKFPSRFFKEDCVVQ